MAGERRLDERVIDWLPGYEGSAPVRFGNGASTQLQLDVFGDLIDSGYQSQLHGIEADPNAWSLLRVLLSWLEDGWRQKDSGMWEMRGPERHFTHSKVMCWVAFDRGVRLHEDFGVEVRWHAGARSATRSGPRCSNAGGRRAAAPLCSPTTATSWTLRHCCIRPSASCRPTTRGWCRRSRRSSASSPYNGLVMRYRPRADGALDGLPEDEGVFLPCTFWLVDALAGQGRHEEARELFERLLDLRNDVGLLSEEYDPDSGRMLGNFPQAFTHLALVNTAMVLGQGRQLREAGSGAAAT